MPKAIRVRAAWLFVVGAVAVVVSTSPQRAEARLQYLRFFGGKYENLKDQVKVAKCAVCHPAEKNPKKLIRNNYGKALEKALEAKDVKNKAVVDAALKKIEKEPSAVKEMTFGDLIKAGKLPASTE